MNGDIPKALLENQQGWLWGYSTQKCYDWDFVVFWCDIEYFQWEEVKVVLCGICKFPWMALGIKEVKVFKRIIVDYIETNIFVEWIM